MSSMANGIPLGMHLQWDTEKLNFPSLKAKALSGNKLLKFKCHQFMGLHP
jgi:hypothetical protein